MALTGINFVCYLSPGMGAMIVCGGGAPTMEQSYVCRMITPNESPHITNWSHMCAGVFGRVHNILFRTYLTILIGCVRNAGVSYTPAHSIRS